jgi:hypothetical protein
MGDGQARLVLADRRDAPHGLGWALSDLGSYGVDEVGGDAVFRFVDVGPSTVRGGGSSVFSSRR